MSEKAKVLVADDERELTEMVETLLVGEGFSVIKAFDGREAVETAKKESPDIILLDIGMPKMDGLKVCETLRKEPAHRSLAILMLTAKSTESDIVGALQSGADDYIAKPFENEELLAKIRKLVAKAGSGRLPSQILPK
jgi:DNA-binding response OmpR family regulator